MNLVIQIKYLLHLEKYIYLYTYNIKQCFIQIYYIPSKYKIIFLIQFKYRLS